MTVSELIEQLQKYEGSLGIHVRSENYDRFGNTADDWTPPIIKEKRNWKGELQWLFIDER